MRFIVSAETFQAIEEGRKTQFSFPAKSNLHDLNASPTGEFVIQAYPSISTIASMSLKPGQPAGIRSRVLVGPKFGYIELYRRLRDFDDVAMFKEGIQLGRFGFWFDDSFEPKRTIREAFELYWSREYNDFNPLTIVHTVYEFQKP